MISQMTAQQGLPGLRDISGLPVVDGCHYFRAFLKADYASELLDTLWADLNWQQKPVRMFGKWIMQPRLISWHCDSGLLYSYSGLEMQPAAWHPHLEELRTRLKTELGWNFNSVLVNAYRDGQDSMGWHSDDEPELGPEPKLASISLGEERCFRWRDYHTRQSKGMNLQHGSLLLMSGQFQHCYQHSIPKTNRQIGLRINLTFRRILQP